MIQVGKPVKGKELIGRGEEIAEIVQYLEMGQSVVLIAPRRFGKTSVVLEALNQLKVKKRYIGFIDIFSHASISSLTHSIVEEVLENNNLKKIYQKTKGSVIGLVKSVKLKTVVEDFEFLLGIEDSTVDDWSNFCDSLDFINDFAEGQNKRMTFAFDEYGDILKFDKSREIIKLMRSKIQDQEAASYIFSGSYESVMQSMFVSSKSPFYRLARVIKLGYLDFNALKSQMTSKLKKYNVKYDEKLIDDILDFLKGHPYYSQLALQQMYLYHMSYNRAPSFEELLEIIVQIDKSYLESIWDDLSASKENVFILKHLTTASKGIFSMAKEKNINASRALKNLEGKGILYKEEGVYHFYDPILEYWIHTTINV